MNMRKNEYDLPFVLNLAEDNHILSAGIYHVEIPQGAITSEYLPDEGHPIIDYRFENGEFIYDPLPEPEPFDPGPSQLDRIEAQVVYTAMMTDTILEA